MHALLWMLLWGCGGPEPEIRDDVTGEVPETPAPLVGEAATRAVVESLDPVRYAGNIEALSDFGDRTQGSESYAAAEAWAVGQLEGMGYAVHQHAYTFQGQPRESLYATRVGRVHPDRMVVVSAHLDGRGGGGAADDDASGVALVLEAARAFAGPGVATGSSVRFILWNNEETGLNGARAYVADRAALQGVEAPAGSGEYPEPTWLAVVQQDMILFDHGLPPGEAQLPEADIDVEYAGTSARAADSAELAEGLRQAAERYAGHPAEVGAAMSHTDSVPFQDHCPAVSVRENPRLSEIGAGSNPHWHQPTDVYATYSEDDLALGFSATQMVVGAVATLVRTRVDGTR